MRNFSLDNKSAGRQSLSSQKGAAGVESDTDSMAEYGEGDTGNASCFINTLKHKTNPEIKDFDKYWTKSVSIFVERLSACPANHKLFF